MKITETTTIQDAMRMSKEIARVLKNYRLNCAGCKGAAQDTIRIVAETNGLDKTAFLRELNEALKKS